MADEYTGFLPAGEAVTDFNNTPTRVGKEGQPYGSTLSPSEGKTFFTMESPEGTIAGDKSQEWDNIITKFEELPPEIQAVIEMNAAGSSSAGPMTPQEYLTARGGVTSNGQYGDTPVWRALNKAEYAAANAAGGDASAYNAALDKKMFTSLVANPSLIPNHTLSAMVQLGQLTPEEGARTFIQSWGKPEKQMLENARAVQMAKLQKPLVEQRDKMVQQMISAGYTQDQIDAQLRASFGGVLGEDGKAGITTINDILGEWSIGAK